MPNLFRSVVLALSAVACAASTTFGFQGGSAAGRGGTVEEWAAKLDVVDTTGDDTTAGGETSGGPTDLAEPGLLALFGTGLALVSYRLRRRA